MEHATQDRPDATPYIVLHILLAPLIVDVTIVLLAMLSALPDRDFNFQIPSADLGEIALVYGALFAFSYVLGLVPSVLHAVAMIILRRWLGRGVVWHLMVPMVGWLSTLLLILLFTGFSPYTLQDSARMALFGSVAAIGCHAIAWMRRIPPVRGAA